MILGTVLKITSTIVVDGGGTVSSATIEIYDPDGNDALSSSGDGIMDESSATPGDWEYVYQSDESDTEGVYQYVITAVSGGREAKSWGSFDLDAKPEVTT